MKKFKISRRRGILIIVIVLALTLLAPNIGSVRAVLTGTHAFYVVWRFEREVLRDSRVGQYYEGLIIKHAKEGLTLLIQDPSGEEKFNAFRDSAVPLLDGYLKGQGDSVFVTAEAIDAFKDILNIWITQGGSSLQKDIQAEYERFPLDHFVGMNMNEAYAYVLGNFTGVLEEPDLVEGTDGKWAYYIYNNVYFEYPSNWYVQVLEINKENKSTIIIIPSSENPDQWDAEWLIVGVAANVPLEAAFNGDYNSFNTDGYNQLWREPIQVGNLNGFEYAAQYKIAAVIAAELYQPEHLMLVDAGVILLDPLGAQLTSDREVVKERYEYFYHLVNSLKISQP
ncbi:MAG: hypothetical protein U0V48_06355 [Anaerolineales bacterium]